MLLESTRIIDLKRLLDEGKKTALDDFWRHAELVGTPLIEPILGREERLVTFLYRDATLGNHCLLLGTPANFESISHRFRNIAGTDLWYLSLPLHKELRTIYGIVPHAPSLPNDFIEHPDYALLGQFFTAMQNHLKQDPLNPQRYIVPKGIWLNPKDLHVSLLELEHAPPQPWVKRQEGISRGQLTQFRFKSEVLGNERNVWLYLPPKVPNVDEKNRGLLVVFDGDAYTSIVPTPTILDNLIHAKKIPPLIALFFDNPDDPTRDRELGCNPLMPRFIEEELVKAVLDENNISYDREKTVIAGSSFGGLGALYAGFASPTSFSRIISLSAHLGFGFEVQREDQWLITEFAKSPRLPLRIFMSVGSLESGPPTFDRKPSFIEANRAMRDVLQDKNYHLRYHEYQGGHDYVCWQDELAQGLIYLFSHEVS